MSREKGAAVSHSPEETKELGRRLGADLSPGSVVLLTGPLGAGKSVLARGIAEALGVLTWRGSPTFTIINEYEGNSPLYHVDLYRLSEHESEDLGLEEYVRPDSVVIVEWANRALEYLLDLAGGNAVQLDLSLIDLERRAITVNDRNSVRSASHPSGGQLR